MVSEVKGKKPHTKHTKMQKIKADSEGSLKKAIAKIVP